MTGDEIPVVDAYDDGVNYRVWCRWCGVWHRHSRGEGDRASHCIEKDSGYRVGYVLRLVGEFTDEVRARHREEERAAARRRRRAS